jgi:hypothetical protein
MRRIVGSVAILFASLLAWLGAALAQGRGPTDWMTTNADAQRSSWVRNDSKISSKTLRSPDFKFLWKLKLEPGTRTQSTVATPSLLERLIGYRGFRMLAFVSTSSDRVIAVDSDLGRIEWEKTLVKTRTNVVSSVSSRSCPGGMTAAVTRPTILTIAPAPNASSGGGRGNPARSAVGEPGLGAVTLNRPTPPPRPAAPPTPTPTPTPRPTRASTADPPGGQFGAGPFLVHALSSDGMFHSLHLSSGEDYQPPKRFLPPNAFATGLVVVESMAYVTTQNRCGGVPDGVWSLDLTSGKVSTWKASLAGSGGIAFGVDGTIYATTGPGGEVANALVALGQDTLAVKDWYAAGSAFSSAPVVFEFKGRILVAASTVDGRIHVLDAAKPGGADHKTALAAASVSKGPLEPGALASWQDADRTRWILVPGVNSSNTTTTKAVGAWKLIDQNGALSLQAGWTSKGMSAPLPPTIINDVVFVTSGGVRAGGQGGASGAAIYALNGITGEELWNSGSMITSQPRFESLSGGIGQIYIGTKGGNLFAFGFPMEH